MADETPSRVSPERLLWFRLGQLVLLLKVLDDTHSDAMTLERLSYYDFLAANPFLVLAAGSMEAVSLEVIGFTSRNLDYQSAAQRFANRRARLQHDLALLVSLGLAEVKGDSHHSVGFTLTEGGQAFEGRFESLYAQQYRKSARAVTKRLKGLSDSRLRERGQEWLRAEGLLMDLYDQ